MKRFWLGCSLLVAGCGTLLAPQQDRSRFFALAVAVEASGSAATPSDSRTVGVGPVRLPEYLDRNEICTRLSAAEIRFSESSRWAAPLRASVPSILAQDLGALLPGARVTTYPWSVAEPVDLQVEVDVRRFEASADGKATLRARWTIRDEKRKVVMVRESSHERAADPKDVAAAVTALSEALGDLAKDVATALPR